MGPLGFFEPADMPSSETEISFLDSAFPEQWTCIPFMYPLKLLEFNPEHQEVRELQAFIIRTDKDGFEAYARICPDRGCPLNFMMNPGDYDWLLNVPNPILYCP